MDGPLHLDAVLTPTRSLPKTGLYVLLGVFAFFNVLVAVLFLVMGAAPVPIFLGLDFLAVVLAFRASYRQTRQKERVQVSADEITVSHELGARRRTVWRSPTAFTRVSVDGEADSAQVRLHLHGRWLPLGRQLGPVERLAFAETLQAAIRSARSERHPAP